MADLFELRFCIKKFTIGVHRNVSRPLLNNPKHG